MRRVSVALALAAVLPVTAARADPITVNVHSSTGGFSGGTASTGWFSIDMGTIAMSPGSTGTFFFSGLKHGSDYTVTVNLGGEARFDTLRMEIFQPTGTQWDRWNPSDMPGYVPAGWATSNKFDGFSFAQDSALERSAVWAGGSARVGADEETHRGDVLLFSGMAGATDARITFGLRDRLGGRGFLVRFSVDDPIATPEPGSMLLLGTGLAGLAAYRRRARAKARQEV